MIGQDKYWRKELRTLAFKLEKRYRLRRWTAPTAFNVEKEIFIGFYIIRKLIENGYISEKLTGHNYKVMSYPYKFYSQNPKHFLHNYNIFKGSKTLMSIKQICDQFVHSYHFSPFIPFQKEMVGIYFCSDKIKEKNIFYLQLCIIVEIFLSIANNNYKPIKLLIKGANIFTNINKL